MKHHYLECTNCGKIITKDEQIKITDAKDTCIQHAACPSCEEIEFYMLDENKDYIQLYKHTENKKTVFTSKQRFPELRGK